MTISYENITMLYSYVVSYHNNYYSEILKRNIEKYSEQILLPFGFLVDIPVVRPFDMWCNHKTKLLGFLIMLIEGQHVVETGLTFKLYNFFNEIYRVVAVSQENSVCEISWKLFENWMRINGILSTRLTF